MSAWCSRSVHVVVADQEHSDYVVPRYWYRTELVWRFVMLTALARHYPSLCNAMCACAVFIFCSWPITCAEDDNVRNRVRTRIHLVLRARYSTVLAIFLWSYTRFERSVVLEPSKPSNVLTYLVSWNWTLPIDYRLALHLLTPNGHRRRS